MINLINKLPALTVIFVLLCSIQVQAGGVTPELKSELKNKTTKPISITKNGNKVSSTDQILKNPNTSQEQPEAVDQNQNQIPIQTPPIVLDPAPQPSTFLCVHAGVDTNFDLAIPIFRDLNLSTIRLWVDFDWNDRQVPWQVQQATKLKQAGFRTIVVFNQARIPTYDEVRNYFDWLQQQPGVLEAIDVWEILNELNLDKYWQGNANQYVNLVLKPAWDSLNPSGEKVLGGSFTAWQNGRWGTTITAQYVAAGYLNYLDYAGLHPYTDTVEQMQTVISEAKLLYGQKPIIMSEWNFKQVEDEGVWSNKLNQVEPFVRQNVVTACHYRFIGFGSEGGWPGLVRFINGAYQPVSTFYNLLKSWGNR
ncbi:MAG: hypothetical protein OHK0017_07520 [Patescibacteria group bacterium]